MKQKHTDSNSKRPAIRWRTLSLCCLSGFASVVLAGCNPDARAKAATQNVASASPVTNPVGTYALVSIDERKVPCALQHQGQGGTIKSGTFVFNADGTCSSKIAFSLP